MAIAKTHILVFLTCFFIYLPHVHYAQNAYLEQDGLVVIEMENVATLNGWETANTITGATGSGYIHWTGDQFFNETGNGKLLYHVKISTPGTYRFEWRVAVGFGNDGTEHNDSWLQIKGGNFFAEKPNSELKPRPACESNPDYDCPEGSSRNGFFKIYGGGVNSFQWAARTSDNDAHSVFVDFPTTGTYEIEVNARSSFHAIDRMVLYHSSVSGNQARSLDNVESPQENTASNLAQVSGELKQWHNIALTFDGPNTSETATPNPFADYDLRVTFSNGNKAYTVPGYYAADGNAAETSAGAGDKWRVHFAPDTAGTWNWSASFKTGTDVAINGGGSSAGFMDGATGSFLVEATDKTGRDNRAKGRLEYVGEHYLKYAGTGEWFVKAGADAPENTLAYDDFDEVPNEGGRRKSWAPHAIDYDTTEAEGYTWQGGKGSELMGAVAYLSEKGVNAFSFLTFNVEGDDKNVFPHLYTNGIGSYGGSNAWSADLHHDRFDVSRMAQWERIFEYADLKGMYLHFKLQETENDQLMDGGDVGRERKLYFRELIARFSHHLALNWNMGEENTQTTDQRKDMAEYFAENDPYQHLRVIHTYPGQKNTVYTPLLGEESDYTGLSLQTSNPDQQQTFGDTRTWVMNSANVGKKWVIAIDEPGSAQVGVDEDPNDRKLTRHRVVWGNFMAGGAGSEFYYGYSTSCDDLDCQNHRTRDQKYTDAAHALKFFQLHFQRYLPDVMNDNDLTPDDNQDYALAKPGTAYAVYRPNGGSTAIDLPTGINWLVKWYNPRTGVLTDGGALTAQLAAPDNNDWTAFIIQGDCSPGTACNDGDDCTNGDTLDADCNCTGTLVDTDNDGVCDAEDACPAFDDALIGTACDDGNPCTLNDLYQPDCSCGGTVAGDQVLELSPIDDAYLQGSTQVNNEELRIEQGNRVSYLKFEIPAYSGTIISASLSLVVGSDPGSGSVIVSTGINSDWTEDNLSTTNAPSEVAQLGVLNTTYLANQAYAWDLDASSFSSGTLTLIVRQTSGNDIAVKASENVDTGNGPKLVLAISDPIDSENCAVLPLNWEQFTATAVGKNSVLEWTTSAEENIRDFIVTHSTDGNSFSPVGEIAPQNEQGPNHYRFVHTPVAAGEHFYQIVQEGLDGNSSQSPIRSVVFFGNAAVTVFPNPFEESIRLQFTDQLRELAIFNAYGAKVYAAPASFEAPVDISLRALPAGVYWVRGFVAGQAWSQRIIKR